MANTVIEIKFSQTPAATPSTLANGEISINTSDGKIFYKDPAGVIQAFLRFIGPAGLNKEIQFNDSGVLGANAGLTFDKATGNLSAQELHTRNFITFADGSKQYTANAGSAGITKFRANVGNASASSFNVAHNLNTMDIVVSVREWSSGYFVYPDIDTLGNNNISIEFASAPTTNQYTVLVIGA